MHLTKVALGTLTLFSLTSTRADAQSLRDVFRQVNESVVVIYTSERTVAPGQGEGLVSIGGLGSGVLISGERVMTAAARSGHSRFSRIYISERLND